MTKGTATAEVETTTKPTTMLTDPWPRLVDWFDTLMPADVGLRSRYTHTIRVEEFTRNGDFVVRAELPGIDPEKDIDVMVANGSIRIQGKREERHEEEHRSEFYYGEFVRTLPLPAGADEGSVHARYEDGILEVTVKLPKKDQSTRHVPVKRVAKVTPE